MQHELQNRYLGCLLGLACGDAVGTSVEFKARGSFTPLTDMIGGGPFNLQAGQWTDDTSMALCLAHSLIHCKGFDAADQMNRYCNWMRLGYMSCTGECFDIGMTVRSALDIYLRTSNPIAGSTDPHSAGNGSIMRLAPVVLYYYDDLDSVLKYSVASSTTTHGTQECLDACHLLALILHSAISGKAKELVLQAGKVTLKSDSINRIAAGDYLLKDRANISGSGYVVHSLEAALWCFATTDNYRDAILTAANLGDDADTTAAICGQIAGAYYGAGGIPESWRNKLAMRDEIENLALNLFTQKPSPQTR